VKLTYVLRDGTVLDETGTAAIDLPPATPGSPAAEPAESLGPDPLSRRGGTALRSVAWNVQLQSPVLRDRQAAIVDALDPDVLLLSEVRQQLTHSELMRWLPEGRSGRPAWRVLAGASEDRTLVAVRGSIEEGLDRVPYAPGGLAAILASGNAIADAWGTAGLTEWGVPASAAVAAVGRRRVLASAVHLQCCGSPESFQEANRVLQAQAIRNVMRSAAQRSRPEAVLIGGDFNLVGARDPLDIAARGLDVDGSALAAAYAPQLDGRSADTWRSRTGAGPFPPGRLDWILYSDSTLELLGAFAFDSDDVALQWLTAHGLRRDDSIRTSDHLPVVADFRWRN
jgi:endonuclease/exonuclease/phosphatase family metal-dependent hydrolase